MSTGTFADLDMTIVGVRRVDDDIPMVGVRFIVTNICLMPVDEGNGGEEDEVTHTVFLRSEGEPEIRYFEVPVLGFASEGIAYRHSFDMLSAIDDDVVRPDVVLQVAPEISYTLRNWSQLAMGAGHTSIDVEIALEIHEMQDYSSSEILDDYLFDEADAMDWAITESVNDDGVVGSAPRFSSSQLDEFLVSCRAQTWDYKTQCVICLECLGGEEEEKLGNNVNVVYQLPCSHLFHGACIKKWFEVSDSCPLCRRTINH